MLKFSLSVIQQALFYWELEKVVTSLLVWRLYRLQWNEPLALIEMHNAQSNNNDFNYIYFRDTINSVIFIHNWVQIEHGKLR